MTPSRIPWLLNLLLVAGTLASLAGAGPVGWFGMVPLVAMLPWLLRARRYVHALLSMVIVLYIGVGLAFRDTPAGMALAWCGAGVFLAAIAFVRMSATEARRAQAREGSAL